MPSASLPMGSIHYEEAGPRDGRPVVFVHGVLMGGELWEPLFAPLAGQGLRCLAPTWPMGAHREAMRPGTDLSPGGMARIVAAFLEALDLHDVVLVGNDSGGAISQVVAAEHPERLGALVLTNCDTLEHFPPGAFKAAPYLARVPGVLRAVLAPMRSARMRRSPLGFGPLSHRDVDDLTGPWIAQLLGDRAVFEDARRFVAGVHKRWTIAAAPKLRDGGLPVTLVWGEDDGLFTVAQAKRFAEVAGPLRLELVPGARTLCMVDRPDRVAELVAEAARAGSAVPVA